MTVGSLFSGAGGFDLGLEAAGFKVAWQAEIDKDCVSVLERHWPAVRRYGDVQDIDPAELAPVDVVIFGSPCQDFSVAGKRAGLDGARSGLFGEAIRIIRGLRPAPAFCVWENVPGALSSAGGRDFGAVLDALADCGALDIAWRVLDARHFGVPQRRRRIFLVADFGAERAGQVLFEPTRSGRDSEACGEAGQGLAGDVEDGAGIVGEPIAYQCHGANVGPIGHLRQGNGGLTGGVPFVASTTGQGWWNEGPGTLRADAGGMEQSSHLVLDTPVAAEGGNRQSGPLDVATACNAHGGPHGRLDFESETFVVANAVQASAGHHGHSSPRGDGSDNLVAVAFDWQKGGGGNDHSWRGKSREWIERAGDYAGSLSATKHDAVAVSENQRGELRETSYTRQITTGGGKPGQGYPSVREGMAVRRLTPRECERLQGWPDDHTRWRPSGDEIADGPRYRMIGNGVASPVARWIGERLRHVMEAAS